MKISILSNRKRLYRIISILIWLLVWEIVSLFVNNDILIAGPLDVAKRLGELCLERDFIGSILGSLLHIAAGFLSGLCLGIIMAILAYNFRFVRELIGPVLALIKAAPVAAFVVLFLIWWHSDVLAIAVSFCVVMPQIYTGVLQGLESADVKLLELAKVYGLKNIEKAAYIFIPAIRPYMNGAIKVAAGLAWKSGVAAEVIGTPEFSIGSKLYMSKIYLDTSGVLAWTLIIILLSCLCEKALVYISGLGLTETLLMRLASLKDRKGTGQTKLASLKLTDINKAYEDKKVLVSFSNEYKKGQEYLLNWASGAGKTSLFNIIAGLSKADTGSISPKDYSVSYLFQEDRLFEELTAMENVAVISGKRKGVRESLEKMGLEAEINSPVKDLSGGQRRRVSIAAALNHESDVLLLDEPYNGLDEDNRERIKAAIDGCRDGQIVIIASHIEV